MEGAGSFKFVVPIYNRYPRIWRKLVSPKRGYPSTALYSVLNMVAAGSSEKLVPVCMTAVIPSQYAVIFRVVVLRTSNITYDD